MTDSRNSDDGAVSDIDFDVAVVGAGFAGMYLIHRLRQMGLSVRVIESGGDVGGTWYWNRYPGARCDVESMQYSYQFSAELQQDWNWKEKYSPQPEILEYANHVADRFELRRDIQFNTRVERAVFDEARRCWRLEFAGGGEVSARHCVMATGCLSAPNLNPIPGIANFKGAHYYTGQWPHEGVDFTGLRVGVIGTGSSAIQSIPEIARQAKHLTVFQRTANYTVPAHNEALEPAKRDAVKANYGEMRARAKKTPPGLDFDINLQPALDSSEEDRLGQYEKRWAFGGLTFMGAFGDLMLDRNANDTAAEFVRGKIREAVADPDVAELLCPDNIIGCKRLCVDTGYWQTYNRDNVTLVDISNSPIEEIGAGGLSVNGADYAFDAIVFATGFDAMTGALLNIDIRGTDNQSLQDKWADGPRAFLGLAMAGFPNLFTVTGPGSPSVLTNMLPSIEQHVEWISDCIGYLADKGLSRIESTREAEEAWVAHNADVAGQSLRSTCNSWYVGANVPGKPRVFMPYIGGFPVYVERCDEIAANGYEGFSLN